MKMRVIPKSKIAAMHPTVPTPELGSGEKDAIPLVEQKYGF